MVVDRSSWSTDKCALLSPPGPEEKQQKNTHISSTNTSDAMFIYLKNKQNKKVSKQVTTGTTKRGKKKGKCKVAKSCVVRYYSVSLSTQQQTHICETKRIAHATSENGWVRAMNESLCFLVVSTCTVFFFYYYYKFPYFLILKSISISYKLLG